MNQDTRRRLLRITKNAMPAGTRFTVPDETRQGESLLIWMYWSHVDDRGQSVKGKARLEYTEEFVDDYEDANENERQSRERRATQIITARCREYAARSHDPNAPDDISHWLIRTIDC